MSMRRALAGVAMGSILACAAAWAAPAPAEPPPPPPVPTELPPPPDVAAPPASAEKTPSGLASLVLQPGSGTVHPRHEDTVRVHYSGWTTDGRMFDSSLLRG